MYSNWIVTVNTNNAGAAGAQQVDELLHGLGVITFNPGQRDQWLRYFDTGTRTRRDLDDTVIGSIRWRVAFERNARGQGHNHGLHIHALLYVIHDSRIAVDGPAMQNLLRAQGGVLGGCNVDVRHADADAAARWLKYMLKTGILPNAWAYAGARPAGQPDVGYAMHPGQLINWP